MTQDRDNPDIYSLLRRAREMPEGQERIALTEEAVRQADLLGDEEAGYFARQELIHAGTYGGQADKMMVAFAWCLNYLDTHIAELGDWERHRMAWYHKWVIHAALDFPQIPWSRVQELHADYARRARALGEGAGSVPFFALEMDMHRGDAPAAQRHFNIWQFAKRDGLSDCAACEAQGVVSYHKFTGDDAASVRQTERMLERQMSCAHIPHITHADVLAPLMRLGEWQKAAEHAQKGRPMVAGAPDHVYSQARHLEYLALTDTGAALDWYNQHRDWAEKTRELGRQFTFHAASAMFFSRLERSGQSAAGEYQVTERLSHHLGAAQRIAGQFDERNGTKQQSRELEKVLALAELQAPWVILN